MQRYKIKIYTFNPVLNTIVQLKHINLPNICVLLLLQLSYQNLQALLKSIVCHVFQHLFAS